MLGYKSRKSFLKTYAIIVGMCLMGFTVRMWKFPEFGIDLQVTFLFTSLVFMPAMWESLRWINRTFDNFFPFERNVTLRIALQLGAGALLGFIIRVVVYLYVEPRLTFQLDKFFAAATWMLYPFFTVAVNLGFFTAYFLDRWKDSIVRAERLEREKSQVQFDNLKNQLNPHFLFNALTSLNSLIFSDQKLASDFLQQLSKVYRYLLQHKDSNFVDFKTELDFIQYYVSLLEIRFHGAVKINFDISKDALTRSVVPVTLQILIENALKHNVVDKDKPLSIDVLTVGDYLVISNNLQLRKAVNNSNKVGLENLRSLYGFLTDRPLLVEQTEKRFSVKVPLV